MAFGWEWGWGGGRKGENEHRQSDVGEEGRPLLSGSLAEACFCPGATETLASSTKYLLPIFISLIRDNPILLVGHLAGRVRKRGSLKALCCGLRRDTPVMYSRPPQHCWGGHWFQKQRRKVPMPDTIHLTPICFRTWGEKIARNPRYSKGPLWSPENRSQGREEVGSGGEGSSLPSSVHLPCYSFH